MTWDIIAIAKILGVPSKTTSSWDATGIRRCAE
jgi:hypothetical protein